jgi:hypothetical protein
MGIETLTRLGVDVHYRQAIQPQHKVGSFTGDDTDNHDFLFSARGKRTTTISIDNAPNASIVWSLYGLHEVDGEVGDAGTFEVDITNTITAATKGGATNTAAFPFYLLRCAYAGAPTDTPKKTVSVYVDLVGN